jgi:hypothetical protein
LSVSEYTAVKVRKNGIKLTEENKIEENFVNGDWNRVQLRLNVDLTAVDNRRYRKYYEMNFLIPLIFSAGAGNMERTDKYICVRSDLNIIFSSAILFCIKVRSQTYTSTPKNIALSLINNTG